ncbi:MAG TPA: NADH-ubiquinone oxidoreductase-F iron-sulfur binding region domain-containing protein [Solirubrobacteraceae bacterium]|nr:NADH-ubiquinone oxidoreductase-F iron-sulfur binding region domain-containing protein [Solirubrobacteraceae bacterium]
MSATSVRRAGPTGLPRLLEGLGPAGSTMTLADHHAVHGRLPAIDGPELIDLVERSGLRGRGGADFPTAIKLRTVAERRRAIAVVVNGSETEPASAKDRLLLARLPHLVLDGAVLAARTIGAREVIVKVGDGSPQVVQALEGAAAVREDAKITFTIVAGPEGYVTGEETAVLNLLARGVAKPTFVPPRPYERGLEGRPTLIQNVETCAQIALIARFGPEWFRELGSDADPGSALVTISGAVRTPGVYELAFGTPMGDLLAAAGGPSEPLQALLVGGYFGTWVKVDKAMRLRLSREDLRGVGCALGSGVLIALGESSCGLHESARITSYLAGQSAGQCGPCVHGLAAIADTVQAFADGRGGPEDLRRLRRWSAEVRGRGACHHPDGVARFVESALAVFGHEIDFHRRQRCTAPAAGLPLGGVVVGARPAPARRAPAERRREPAPRRRATR